MVAQFMLQTEQQYNCTTELSNEDFMDPYNIVQLANDTVILAENLISLKSKFISIFNYSKMKYQVANIDKTVHCNFPSNQNQNPL